MMGKSFEQAQIHTGQTSHGYDAHDRNKSADKSPLSPMEPISFAITIGARTLNDPIFQDLSPVTRYYVDYCKPATDFCSIVKY